VNSEKGLYYGLADSGALKRILPQGAIEYARVNPPPNTRAAARAAIIKRLIDSGTRKYVIDWDSVYLDRERYLNLQDPFKTYSDEVSEFVGGIS